MPFVPKQVRNRFLPNKSFENYIVTYDGRSSRAGLTGVDQRRFTKLIDGNQDDTMARASIGFNMLFDSVVNTTYQQFIACSNGFLVLVDPASASQSDSSVVANTTSSNIDNRQINSTFLDNSALVCAWFDDLFTLYNAASQVTGLAAGDQTRVNNGTEAVPTLLNPWEAGVWYCYDTDPVMGLRRTIIRWATTSYFNNSSMSTMSYSLKFEIVLYENGRIELRYPFLPGPPANAPNAASGATTGIFMPGSLWRFRDVVVAPTQYLGRVPYKYGGYVSGSFTDANGGGTPYVASQTVSQNWPGRTSDKGVTVTFQPPPLRKKVLPRNLIRTLDSRINQPLPWQYTDLIERFDDRRTQLFVSNSIVNYPSMLQRFYGEPTVDVSQLQELYFNDFEVTGSTVKGVSDQWITNVSNQAIVPYSEARQLEQNPAVKSSQFYLTSSRPDEIGTLGFKQTLGSKTQIKLSFPLFISTTLLSTTASIWYYDTTSKSLQCPAPFDLTSAKTHALRINEDGKGFGPVGNRLASGSNALTANGTTQSDNSFSGLYEGAAPVLQIGAATLALSGTGQFGKSVQTGSSYWAPLSQSFTLPINRPFLIEKAIIELPIQAGPGWFNDLTTTFAPILSGTNSGFDFGGPAVTVSLFNQFNIPPGGAQGSKRELILSGVFTHKNDVTASYAIDKQSATWAQLRNIGFLSFASQPAGIVTASAGSQYTGSVIMLADAAVQNGVILALTGSGGSSDTNLGNLLQQPTVPVTSLINSWLYAKIAYIEPFGRLGSGFGQTGRSLFGRDRNTLLNTTLPNPLYFPNDVAYLLTQFGTGGPISTASVRTALNATVTRRSPYVVLPGDSLILGLSKTRPVMRNAANDPGTFASGTTGYSHDIIIPSGAIYMTLYGSYVTEATEWHEPVKQPLSSDAIHLVIGDEPILDQFELENRFLMSGSYTDDFVTGSMFNNIRGRVFSVLNPLGVGTFGSDLFSTFTQKPSSFAGLTTVVSINNQSEQLYDSMPPNIDDIMRADGKELSCATFRPPFGLDLQPVNYAIAYLDISSATNASVAAISNNVWSRAFPFEPRYSSLLRASKLKRNFSCGYKTTVGGSSTEGDSITAVSPSILTTSSILIKSNQFNITYPDDDAIKVRAFVAIDCTGSAGPYQSNEGAAATGLLPQTANDSIRTFFGIGSINTVTQSFGTTAGVDYRHVSVHDSRGEGFVASNKATVIGIGPILRGWKYGLINGFPQFSKCIWSRGRYGQFRDMLEQRIDTKFFNNETNVGTSPVHVTFVNVSGSRIDAADTVQSQNLSFEATSSLPYIDGLALNR